MPNCSNCHREIEPADSIFQVIQPDLGLHETVCSGSCLVELAWRIRESVPKLSKSKRD
jgi:hypothetical protein